MFSGPRVRPKGRAALCWHAQVPCDPTLYALGTPASPQCTPTAGPRRHCGRVVRDEFIDAKEQRLLIEIMERAMRGLYHQGAKGQLHTPAPRPSARLLRAHGRCPPPCSTASRDASGGQTSFAPDASSAATQMGEPGQIFYEDVVRRVRATIEADFDVPRLYNAGACRSPLSEPAPAHLSPSAVG